MLRTNTKPKGIKKSKVGFSIDIETNQELDKYCQKNLTNKSKLIDKIIKDFLESKDIYENNKSVNV